MEKVRASRIYTIVAIVVVLGLCLSTVFGSLAGGYVGYYFANRQFQALSASDGETAQQTIAKTVDATQDIAVATPTLAEPVDASRIFEDIYAHVNPAVVNINVAVEGAAGVSPFTDPDAPNYQYGSGSGFVYDRDGHIVTNNHVVAEAAKINVTFSDDTVVPATVVGRDPDSDLAVIKVDPDGLNLVTVELGDSDTLKVGQEVVAIGNPFGFAGTLTTGIISGLSRSLPSTAATQGGSYVIPEVIQTDAAINPGNSGGPLLDLKGRVIGVNAAIESPVPGSSGIGFAIPVSLVKQIVPVLIEKGEYIYPWLGISGGTLQPEVAEAMGLSRDQRGALVVTVTEGGPSDAADLVPSEDVVQIDGIPVPIGGDVIVEIDGYPIRTFDDLIIRLVRFHQAGDKAQFTVLRGGDRVTVMVTLEARPTAR